MSRYEIKIIFKSLMSVMGAPPTLVVGFHVYDGVFGGACYWQLSCSGTDLSLSSSVGSARDINPCSLQVKEVCYRFESELLEVG